MAMQIPMNAPAWVHQLAQVAAGAAAQSRKAMETMNALQREISALKSSPRRTDIRYVEDIPGQRVPYELLVSIPIAAGSQGPFTETATVSADGPFVATHRVLAFISNLSFQVQGEGAAVATFVGRSFGRYRAVHSACDFMDATTGFNNPIGAAAPGTGLFSLVSSNQHSPFRTMQWDGTIKCQAAGSGFKRQNSPIPSSIWAPGIGGVCELPALDYFAPTTSVEFEVQSTHINNPNAGNIQTLVGALPYLDSQYDTHEGITYAAAVADPTTADIITRLPNGILIVGFRGYRIVQPQGAAYEE